MKKIISALFVFGFLALGAQTAHALGAPIIYQPYASSITATSAVLNGSVNPNGYSTNAWFTTPQSGSQQLFFQNLGSGTSPVTMSSYTLTGLTPNTTYSFGVSATNSYGNSYSALIYFTTTSNGGCTTGCNPPPPPPPPTPPQAPYVNLSANPTSVSYNGSSTLSWNSSNATSCYASGGSNGWSGSKPLNGNFYTGNLTNTTSYNITCTGAGGSASDSVTVYVAPQPYNPPTPPQTPAPTVNLTANPMSIAYGGSSTLSWSSTNATSCNATGGSNGWAGYKNTSGTFYTGNLVTTTSYNLTCTGSGGSASDSVTVYVASQPYNPPTQTPAPTVTLTASQTNVILGGSATLSWNSTNATSCNASGGSNGWAGAKALNGVFYTGNLNYTTSYSIVCTGAGGSASDFVSIYVDQNNNDNNDLNVTTNSATNIDEDSATLRGTVVGDGVTVWFEWGEDNDLDENTNDQNLGDTNGTTFSRNISNLDQDTKYYFRAVAKDENGNTDYGQILSFQTCDSNDDCGNNNSDDKPSVTTDSATNIANTTATLNGELEDLGGDNEADVWFEYGDDRNDVEDGDAEETNRENMDDEDNFSDRINGLDSNTTYYFRAVARNSEGTDYGSIRTFRTHGGNNDNGCESNFCAPQAITTLATSIGNNSARLNGIGIINDTAQTNAYFEWGSNTNLNNATPSAFLATSGSNPYFASVFGLSSNTTYYYRAIVTNQFGTSYGDITSFRTGGGTNSGGGSVLGATTTVIRNTTTVVGGNSRPSLVFLSVSHNDEIVHRGEIIEYVINYKNISSKKLKDAVLRVAFPKELQFLETSRGYFSEPNNTVVVNVGDLNPNDEGSVFITAKVLPTAQEGKIIVITANLAYTIVSDNTQEEVFAYSKNTIENGSVLGANALFGAGFLPNSLFGWLLLLLIILLIILIARMAYNHGRPQHQTVIMPGTGAPAQSTHRDSLL